MKKVLLFFVSLVSAASLAWASTPDSYTAIGDPNQPNNAVDMNSITSTLWTCTFTPGGTNGMGDSGADGSGSYYGSQANLGNAWQMYSYQNDGVGNGGSAYANTTFGGGALTLGQTVSINFNMRAVDPASGTNAAGQVGLSLLNGSGKAITFYIYGGAPGGNYLYTDAGSTAATAGSMGYQYQNAMHVSFTLTGPSSYSASVIATNGAGSDSWTGTFAGSLVGMQVFNMAGGNGSDVGFNNLAVVPEPGTLALVAGGLVTLLGYRFRRGNRRA